ncbi:Superfamily II RNA helicase [Phaeobacter italicus]|jgi:ATP-dependent RNA helicase SUPV3L1/SUV3|uniref:Superfamily II RNA helicase n=1 Tax=Phaeobacter italicus TaxID=481446 RepID=A0A0H5D5L0_9RHOB|nr:helicase-related protein [Phaeobacter italicus]CRL11983.1 Superfamily II RNA helicase [Phaeobacter italicus]
MTGAQISGDRRIVAVLGPTNTGKTHYAIERMLGYRTGIMGFPLRLLAREVYDKVVAARGPSVVALVTGEERIVPPRAQYWICTVEAMPEGMGCDFLAIDEIQLCADPERGHVFTDRLLRARGTRETLFLGADTMRGPISALVPGVQFMRRERMSDLVYSGSKKISRMPPRTAIVGFSIDNVYAIAELIRRQKGGAAVVMGALSPRTRNAQVAMYQNGEVDYLVATDAIGMGLNLDIDHVAFSSLSKFDGRRMRQLAPNELAQIAGRAGRGMSHGSFGVTGDAPPLDDGVAQAIMEHRFTPLKKLNWRNSALQFGTVEALIRSLESPPQDETLVRAREADDLIALKSLSQQDEILARTTNAQSVRLLWDVCRVPDFRGISQSEHSGLLGVLFQYLHGSGVVPDDWLARQIKRIDRVDGDIDALSKRLAFIRTWTYVAQRNGWVRDESHWRGETRAVEDRLSDALHERLTQRFVDRRTSVLLRRLKQKEALLAEVNDKGEVTVEGEFVGRLEGFRFSPDNGAQGAEAKALKSASMQALAPQFHLRADRFYNAPDTEIDFTDQGGLMWGEHAVGKLVAGADPLNPQIEVFVDEAAGPDVAQKVERRLQHFISRKINALFEPLLNLQRDEELTGLARGFAFRMVEALGILPRAAVAQEVKDLDQDARGALRKHGIRFGQFTIFMPLLLKPAPTRLRLVLWALSQGLSEFPDSPPAGLVTVPVNADAPEGYDTMCGYRDAGERMIRIDMLERLADMLRNEDSRGGFEAKPDMLSITGMTLEQFADLMQGLGYNADKGERVKAKPVDAVVTETGTPAADVPVMDAAQQAENTPAAAPDETDTAAVTEDNAVADVTPADVPAEVANIADAGAAPVAETLADAAASDPIPETAEIETPVGDAADAKVEEQEMEVFYTFTWGRARNAKGGQRGAGRRGQQAGDGEGRGGAKRGGDGPRGKGGKPRGGKPGKKGGPRQDQGSKTYSARPPKKEKQIDPDNPFAAALMGLKQGD